MDKRLEIKSLGDISRHEQALIQAVSHIIPIKRGVVVADADNNPLVVWNNGEHILIMAWDASVACPPPGSMVDMSIQDSDLMSNLSTPKNTRMN